MPDAWNNTFSNKITNTPHQKQLKVAFKSEHTVTRTSTLSKMWPCAENVEYDGSDNQLPNKPDNK